MRSDAIRLLDLVNRYDQNVPEVSPEMGSSRVESPGDNQDRYSYVDMDGGDLYINDKKQPRTRGSRTLKIR